EHSESVKVHGSLSTNDGEVALNWALDGQGILLRAEWNLADHLRSGRLVEVLGDYQTPPADIYAVYLERLNLSAKVSCFIEHLRAFFRQGDNLAAWQCADTTGRRRSRDEITLYSAPFASTGIRPCARFCSSSMSSPPSARPSGWSMACAGCRPTSPP
ncbi:MAG: LysR substrate-binding domain-containing protein, partial [Pseudomonas sp.]